MPTSPRCPAAAVLLLAAGAAWGAARAGDAAAPTRPIGVVRIESVFNQYEYYKARLDAVQKQAAPFESDMARLMADMQKLLDEEDRARKQGLAPSAPIFQDIDLRKQRLGTEMQLVQNRHAELVRRLGVEMLQDVYRYFNMACRNFGSKFGYMAIITALDDKLPDFSQNPEPVLTPTVLSEIMMRSFQWVHPACDVTEYILRDLNEQYRRHQANPATPIYQPAG